MRPSRTSCATLDAAMTFETETIRAYRGDIDDRFGSRVRRAGGEVIVPGNPQFDTARRVYNRLHDPRPLALVRTLNPNLLFEAAQDCERLGLALAVRGGGHHIGGGSGGDGGVVLDFSTFRGVSYCARTGACRVQPGARLGDVDRELARHGRVIPTGTVSDTGIAGLVLGGGIGWLTGALGLTCDHLTGADVLLADGRVIRTEEADPGGVLWALRGGGGVGVVLEMRFRTAPLPVTAAGSILVTDNVAGALVRLLDYLGAGCPRYLTVAPVLGRDAGGRVFMRVEYCCASGEGRAVAELLDRLPGATHAPFGGSFVRWQAHLDKDFLPPQRGYWKACYLRDIPATEASALVAALLNAPSARTSILIEHLHGAFTEVDEISSAFPLRGARFGVLFAARWLDARYDEQNIGWVSESYHRLDPGDERPVYANYASPQDARAASSFSSEAREHLRRLRARYDFAALSRRPGALATSGHAGAPR